jgi:adenosine deaminase
VVSASLDYFHALPKAELHLHLDGSVRPTTVLELAAQQGVRLPSQHLDQLRQYLVAPPDTGSLIEYIQYFALEIAVMQTEAALERVTYELCADLATENVRYAEIRFGPLLHGRRGLDAKQVIAATVRGWEAGAKAHNLEGGIIVCALRDMDPSENAALARTAVGFAGKGVLGFDVAGDEANFPPGLHREAFAIAQAGGLGITAHAGEAAGPESVLGALALGVLRIGHGVRAWEDPGLVRRAAREGIQMDLCPTSNVGTKAVARLEDHPLPRFVQAGVKVTISTDSRTVGNTTLTTEFALSEEHFGLARDTLWEINLQALRNAFVPAAQRRALEERFERERQALANATRS